MHNLVRHVRERRRRWLAMTTFAAATSAACGSDPTGSRPAEAQPIAARDPLPAWGNSPAKDAIVDFVTRVTDEHGPAYVPPPERIAVFDNDGTLWVEQPFPTQLAFALDRVKTMAATHPEWKQRQPFKAILAGDVGALAKSGERGIAEVVAATHVNNTTDEFTAIVTAWIATARHPTLDQRYLELVYQPMVEVLAYLRANGFKTYIVSGGGVEFMRPWTERSYGVPPEQVIGTRAKVKYEIMGGVPVLYRLPQIDLMDNHAGKPVGINQMIGRRPIIAFGNSDGDFEMLEWTTSAPGKRLGVIIHHTDAVREFAYDANFVYAPLVRALAQASERGWIVVDMKRDWRTIFSWEKK